MKEFRIQYTYIIFASFTKVKKDLKRQPAFDPITFTFSENSNCGQKCLLEV